MAEPGRTVAIVGPTGAGKTTYGKHAFKDNEGYVYRKDDGTFVAFRTAGNELRRGTWSVRNDMFCRQPEGEDNRCREVYDQGDGTYMYRM